MTKMLVVDDHAVVRQGVKQILSEQFHGAIIGEAQSAEEMLDRVRKNNWDIVVLDIGMPGKSGLDALKELKQLRPKTSRPCAQRLSGGSTRTPHAQSRRLRLSDKRQRPE